MPNIKALAFDVYGTLLDVHSVIALCERLFPGQGEALSKLWRSKQLEYSWLRTGMGRYDDFWVCTEGGLTYACNMMNLECPQSAKDELMNAYLHLSPFAEVQDALKALKEKARLAILSNGAPKMLNEVAENTGIRWAFSDVISVEEVQTFKPSPRVYNLGPDKLGLSKDEVGFVSANYWDVAGAKSYGLWVAWINRTGAPEDELGFRPDVILNDLAALPAAIPS